MTSSAMNDATLSEILSAVVHEDAGALGRLFDYLRLLQFDDSALDRIGEAVALRDAVSPYMNAQREHLFTLVEREWLQVLTDGVRESFEGLFGTKDRS
jgi:hypothetical protein